MQTSELAFYPTQELIDELMRRTTFLGVVVHSEGELRDKDWNGERLFQVRINNNLDVAQAGRLLDAVAEYIDVNHS
jgi:hypothetical protein